jgi:pimeloyl-ACP methyl ester carboxylesterase
VDAIGVSLGSEFLARAAAEAPEAFGSVTLVSPTGFNGPTLREGAPGSTRGKAGVRAVLTQPTWARRLFGLLTRRPVIRYFLERTWGSRNIDEGMLDYDYATTRPVGAEHAPLNFLSGFLFSADSGQVYRALKQPVLVVHGVRGDFTDFRGTRLMADKPNWTIDVLQTGALPHFELPTQFIERYDAWRAKSA